jgi:hypothetical protein
MASVQGKNFDEAPPTQAPAPTLLYTKPTFLKQTKVKMNVVVFFLLNFYNLNCCKSELEKREHVTVCEIFNNPIIKVGAGAVGAVAGAA